MKIKVVKDYEDCYEVELEDLNLTFNTFNRVIISTFIALISFINY